MEEIAEEHWLRDNTVSDNDREAYVKGFLACAESMYSEKEVFNLLNHTLRAGFFIQDKKELKEWFELVKKK